MERETCKELGSVCSRVRFGAHSVPLTVPVSDGTSPAGRVEWGREGKERNRGG